MIETEIVRKTRMIRKRFIIDWFMNYKDNLFSLNVKKLNSGIIGWNDLTITIPNECGPI